MLTVSANDVCVAGLLIRECVRWRRSQPRPRGMRYDCVFYGLTLLYHIVGKRAANFSITSSITSLLSGSAATGSPIHGRHTAAVVFLKFLAKHAAQVEVQPTRGNERTRAYSIFYCAADRDRQRHEGKHDQDDDGEEKEEGEEKEGEEIEEEEEKVEKKKDGRKKRDRGRRDQQLPPSQYSSTGASGPRRSARMHASSRSLSPIPVSSSLSSSSSSSSSSSCHYRRHHPSLHQRAWLGGPALPDQRWLHWMGECRCLTRGCQCGIMYLMRRMTMMMSVMKRVMCVHRQLLRDGGG